MARCINARCRMILEEEWSYCPRCGTDNRAPEERVSVSEHAHRFVKQELFCTVCGYVQGQPGRTRWSQIVFGLVMIGLALASFGACLDIIVVTEGGKGLFMDQIRILHEMQDSPFSPKNPASTYLCGFSLFMGIALLITAFDSIFPRRRGRLRSGLRSTYFGDDDSWWGGRRGCGWWW